MPYKDPVASAKRRFAKLKVSQEFPALPGMEKRQPPPLNVIFEVESPSSNPYEQGFIQMRFRRDRMEFRWDGEKEWLEIGWHEMMAWLGQPERHVPQTLEELKAQAKEDGYNEGLSDAVAEWKARCLEEAIIIVRNDNVVARRAAAEAAEVVRKGFHLIRDGGSLDTPDTNTKEAVETPSGPRLA